MQNVISFVIGGSCIFVGTVELIFGFKCNPEDTAEQKDVESGANAGNRVTSGPEGPTLTVNVTPQQAAQGASWAVRSGLFGGGGAPVTNAPTPTPAATPMATPMPAMAGTNAPVPVAAPTPMGETFTREQYRQMTGQDLPPGEYDDAQGRPFLIR